MEQFNSNITMEDQFRESFKKFAKTNIYSLSSTSLDKIFDEFKETQDYHIRASNMYKIELVSDIYDELRNEINTLKVGDVVFNINDPDEIWGTITGFDRNVGFLHTGRIVKLHMQNINWRKLYIDQEIEKVPNVLNMIIGRHVRNMETQKFMGCIEKEVDNDGESIYILNTGLTIKKKDRNKKWYLQKGKKSIVTYNTWGGWTVPEHGIQKLNEFYNKFRLSNIREFRSCDHDLHEDEYLADLVKADKKEGTKLFPNLSVGEISYEDYLKGYYRIDEYDGIETLVWNRDASLKDDEVSKLKKELEMAKKINIILQNELVKAYSDKKEK